MDFGDLRIIGILRADYDVPELIEKYGHYYDTFKRLFHQVKPDLEFNIYDVPNGEMPREPNECNGYLITGSRSGVYQGDEEAWINEMAELVRKIAAAGVPQAGICFGHQMIAYAFGGKVEKSDKGWGIGVHSYDMRMPSRYLGNKFSVLAAHQDQIIQPPENIKVLASSEFCPVAAMKCEKRKFISFQGHPELDVEFLTDLIDRRAEDIGAAVVAQAKATINNPTNELEIAEKILGFFAKNQVK